MRFGAMACFCFVAALGCGGAVAVAPADAGPDSSQPVDDSGSGSDDASTAAPPKLAPRRLVFHNQEDVDGMMSGVAALRRPNDESDIVDYVYYWGKSATEKLSTTPLATFPKANRDPVFVVDNAIAAPAGATHLLAFSRNAVGETGPVEASLAFVPPVFRDVSAGAPGNTARSPSAGFDTRNRRLTIMGTPALDAPSVGGGARYISCDAQGKGCTTKAVVWPDNYSGVLRGSLALDTADDRLLFTLTRNTASLDEPVTIRCKLDGTNCTTIGLQAPLDHAVTDSTVFDSKASRFLVTLVQTSSAFNQSVILHCKSDATNCVRGFDPVELYSVMRPVLDEKHDKLLVIAAVPNANEFKLLICDRDGATCATHSVLASAGHGGAGHPFVDYANDRLAVVANEGELVLYRIALDGSSSDRQVLRPKLAPFVSVVVDEEGGHFAVSTRDGWDGVPVVVRCSFDGARCTTREISAGQPVNGFLNMTSTYDPDLRMLYMVYEKSDTVPNHPGMVMLGL